MEILEVIVISLLLVWAFSKLVKTSFNLIELYKAQNDPNSSHWREGSGLLFNNKTRKIEAPSRRVILPFE